LNFWADPFFCFVSRFCLSGGLLFVRFASFVLAPLAIGQRAQLYHEPFFLTQQFFDRGLDLISGSAARFISGLAGSKM